MAIQNDDRYPILTRIINLLEPEADAEAARQANETARQAAEADRESSVNSIKSAYDAATKANLSVEVTNARGNKPTLEDRLDNVDALLALLSPPGKISYFARNTAPSGWLKANGAAISRTTYSDLFAAIGTTFGVGDGSTTFNLPDLRGQFLRGWDDGAGVDSGRAFGTNQTDDLKSHGHVETLASQYQVAAGSSTGLYGITAGAATTSPAAQSTQLTGGTETRPKNVSLLACIKY